MVILPNIVEWLFLVSKSFC